MNNDEYVDDDGILQTLIHKERVANRQRRQNNTVVGEAQGIRDVLKQYLDENV